MNFRSFRQDERGNVILIAAFLMLVLTAFAGLVVDGGHLYMTKAHLQKAANAAALSGGQELTTNAGIEVDSIVDEILEAHDALPFLQNISVTPEENVTVQLSESVPLFFASIVGIDDVDVSVKAKVEVGVMGRASGAAPIGIDDSIPLIYGNEYTLKVDETASETGYFGALALEGPGAKLYEENLMYGFDGELKIGDIINTQTGNIAGPTKSAVDYLISTCSDMTARDCPRILLIPVYVPYNVESNQMKQVKITGFAYFYISEAMDSHDKTIKGIFLKRVGTGFQLEDAANKGAYTIRLVE
ncbi:MAG: pilus assembly protein TadG-related protein [Paenisporosarcina sp.]